MTLAVWPFSSLGRDAHPQTATEPITDWMRSAWALFERQAPVSWLALAVVAGLLVWTALRLRRAAPAPSAPGEPAAGTAWAALLAPLALVALLVVPALFSGLRAPAPAEGALRVEVVGHQWWWEFRYPGEGFQTATDLHVPLGRAVTLEFESRDVKHSFWVPAVGPVQDVLPGEKREFTFTPERAGIYPGQCTELCGAAHAHMRVFLYVEEPAEYERWVKSQQAPRVEPDSSVDNPLWEGREIFITHSCRGCHTVRGLTEGPIGPDLTHFASRGTIAGGMFDRTDENLARWLLHANELKPGSSMPGLPIPEFQLTPLVAWLQSLR